MRALLTCALVALLVPAVRADDKKKPAKPVVVPFTVLKSGHMGVEVKVNGKGPYLLIFDTGAPISLVNNKLAKDADLLKGMPKLPFTFMGGVGEAKIKSLEVGGAKADDVSAIVMDHPTVAAIGKAVGKELYGIVGFPFFARFKMTLDYKAKTMTLTPSGYKPPDVMKAMNAVLMSAVLGGEQTAKVLSPKAQWGIVASKEEGDDDDGVDVKSVVAGSAADKAGLKRGDRLLTLDDRWTDSVADLYEAAGFVKPGTTVVVRVKRGGKEVDLKVTPAKGM
jgi:hypothetical protein